MCNKKYVKAKNERDKIPKFNFQANSNVRKALETPIITPEGPLRAYSSQILGKVIIILRKKR